MRHLLWVLLAGLLATAIAQAQEQTAIERLAEDALDTQQQTAAEVVEPEEEATHKTAQGILEAVGDIVASLSPSPEMPALEATSDPVQPNGTVAEASESVPSETEETPTETNETVLTEASEAVAEEEEATPTEAPPPEEAQPAEVAEVKLTKKERKAVRMYNTAVDQVLVILSKKLNEVGPIPIALDEESLLALDAEEEEPEPEPETTPEMNDSTRTRKKGNKKNRKNNGNKKNNKNNNRRRNQNRKNNNNKEVGKSNGQTRRNKNNSAERNNNSSEKGNKKNKNNKNKNDNNSREKNNNGRRRNNKNNRNQGNKNRRNNQNKDDSSHLKREPKALDDNVEMIDIAQGRRKDTQAQPPNNQSGNKRKANKRNDKKNKKKKAKNNKGRMDLESRADTGPSLPTAEELSQSNGLLTGLAKLTRNGDVRVDLSGKKQKINADITIGPLEVNLKDKTKALTKAQVTTSLTAQIAFKVRSVRGRNKIHIEGIEVTELLPEEVGVTRSDLELEDEVITLAKQQVVGAVDTARVGRILSKVLTNIFDEDNIVENLDSHPLLSRK